MNARPRLLVALVLALTVLASALLWWQAGRAQALLRSQVLAEAEQRSAHLADAMAGQVEGLFALFDLDLQYLRREWLRDPASIDGLPALMPGGMPRDGITHVVVADREGRLVFNSLGHASPPSIEDRPQFRALSDGVDRLYIGAPLQSRLTGVWTVIVARPILRDGRFDGILQLAVSTDHLARRLTSIELSPKDIVALIDLDGRFLARSRDNAASMGQSLPSDRPFLSDPAAMGGNFRVVGQVDGTARTYGWHRVPERGLVVSVGLADEGVLAPLAPALQRARNLTTVLTLVLLAGGLSLAVLLLRLARSDAQAQAARALRDRLFDSSQVAMVVLDPKTFLIVECNEAAARAYGRRDRSEVLGRSAIDVSAPVQYDGMTSEEAGQVWVRRALVEGSVVFQWLHQRPDGQRWDAEVHLMRFETEGRTLLQFTLLDITARRQAEAALKGSEARLKEAQRIAAIGSWELDLRSGHLTWSDETFCILELDPVRVTPSYKGFILAVHPDDRDEVTRVYGESVRLREPYDLVHRLLMPDGRVKHVHETGFTEFDGDLPVRSVGTVQDITTQHETEEALRRLNEELEDRVSERTRELSQLNRELESFAYSVSHDLRTPLRSINGYASLIADDHAARLDEEALSHLDRIRQSANWMGQLIDAMLALARVNQAELRPVPVDLSGMARAVAAELAAAEPQREIRWHIEPGMQVRADAGLMLVVVQNLLGNAWKYSRLARVAEVRFERVASEEGMAVFAVSDNGAGFDMRYAAQLFEPFRRLHGHHEFEGTGVGLASVLRVVERHGGWIRGQGVPGQGARFEFALPDLDEPV